MMAWFVFGFNVEFVEVEETLAQVARVLGEQPSMVTTRAGQPRVGLTSQCAIHIAYDDRTRARIRQEAERLLWAARCGIPVPEVRDQRPEWLITARAVNDEVTSGALYIDAAVAAARALATASEPPPSVRGPAPAHGGGRRAGAERLYRILRSPLAPAEFRSARTAAARLARDTLAHGDYVLHNILFDSGRARVTVIDWEFLNYAPAGFDLCVLWPRLPEAEDRDRVLDAVLKDVPDRAAFGVLHHWLAVRYLADLVTRIPPPQWSRERIDQAVRRLTEARANAAAWGA
jgi:aminoglycoside phosphotransferase